MAKILKIIAICFAALRFPLPIINFAFGINHRDSTCVNDVRTYLIGSGISEFLLPFVFIWVAVQLGKPEKITTTTTTTTYTNGKKEVDVSTSSSHNVAMGSYR